jgi:transposase
MDHLVGALLPPAHNAAGPPHRGPRLPGDVRPAVRPGTRIEIRFRVPVRRVEREQNRTESRGEPATSIDGGLEERVLVRQQPRAVGIAGRRLGVGEFGRVPVRLSRDLERENADLLRRLTGRTSERTGRRTTKDPRPKNDPEAQKKRAANREARRSTCPTEDVPHPVHPAAMACCPSCGSAPMSPLSPETSDEYEWLPGRLVRRRHVREQAVCGRCGRFESGDAPQRVIDGGLYGPAFHARVVVHKLLDSVPLYRQVQAFRREGLHVARATLVDLFHRTALILAPLYAHLLARVPEARVVFADETSLKMQRVEKLGFVWVFATLRVVAYVFSPRRSGQTPMRVLGDTTGVLVVDGYTGYNEVTVPERRVRAGCNGHARRKFANVDDDGSGPPASNEPRWRRSAGTTGARRAKRAPGERRHVPISPEPHARATPCGTCGEGRVLDVRASSCTTRFGPDLTPILPTGVPSPPGLPEHLACRVVCPHGLTHGDTLC